MHGLRLGLYLAKKVRPDRPFMAELDSRIEGKTIELFGSYGWGGGEWMREWESRVTSDGAAVLSGEGIIGTAT